MVTSRGLLQSAFLIGETAPGGSSMGKRLYWSSIVAAFAVGIALVLAFEPLLPQIVSQPAPLPTVTRLQTTTPTRLQTTTTRVPQKFEVVDGDTVRLELRPYRLVGFNTPESGTNAQCAAERALSAKATRRLRELMESAEPYLERVPCACLPGTEGTERCNYGRLCGILKVSGADVASIMIAEGLAEPYECAGTRCPPRKNWCR